MYKSLLLLCLVGVVIQAVPLDLRPPESEDPTCTTDDGKEGLCVRYYLCDINYNIIYDGFGIINIRSDTFWLDRSTRDLTITEGHSSSVQDNTCKSYLDTCCNIPDARKSVKPMTPRPYKQIRNPDGGCGWRNPDGIGLNTTGGKGGESKFGEFPWMVAILKIEQLNPDGQQLNVYFGGGSLIHPAVVLTTAHHVRSPGTLKVRAGEWNTQTVKEKYPYQERDVDSIVVHQDFNTKRSIPGVIVKCAQAHICFEYKMLYSLGNKMYGSVKDNLFYDIALLFLSSPMDISIPNVGLACLPPPRQRTAGGLPCVASGWGKDKFGIKGRYQNILKRVTVPVVERNQCQTQLRKTPLGHFFELHSSFMCAGGEAGIDTCQGDGGSPLMCPIENQPFRYMQSGLVAWGVGCGEEGTPGVYVDVSNLRDWIDDKIVDQGFDPMVYTF